MSRISLTITKKYLEYIDEIFKQKRYSTNLKSREDLEWMCDGDIFYYYEFEDVPARLELDGNVYRVYAVVGDYEEEIGYTSVNNIMSYMTDRCRISTDGGRGCEVYENDSGRMKYGETNFYPYEVKLWCN